MKGLLLSFNNIYSCVLEEEQWDSGRGQKDTSCRSQFSPSFLWVPGTQPDRLSSKALTHGAILLDPLLGFNRQFPGTTFPLHLCRAIEAQGKTAVPQVDPTGSFLRDII